MEIRKKCEAEAEAMVKKTNAIQVRRPVFICIFVVHISAVFTAAALAYSVYICYRSIHLAIF